MILRSLPTLTILRFYDFVFRADQECWESVTFSEFWLTFQMSESYIDYVKYFQLF